MDSENAPRVLHLAGMIGVIIAQAYSTGTRMYNEDAQLKTEMTKNQAHMDTWNALRNKRKVNKLETHTSKVRKKRGKIVPLIVVNTATSNRQPKTLNVKSLIPPT